MSMDLKKELDISIQAAMDASKVILEIYNSNFKIEYKDDKIICRKCKKYYPVKDDIPIMLIEEAKPLES